MEPITCFGCLHHPLCVVRIKFDVARTEGNLRRMIKWEDLQSIFEVIAQSCTSYKDRGTTAQRA